MTDIYKWLFGGRGRNAVRNPLPPLPSVLQPHAVAIGATVQPIIAGSVLDGPPAGPADCQLGGRPWWPRGRPFPCGADGKPLYLLIQINFADLPPLEPFPRAGLLQMFIGSDDLFGVNLDDLEAPSGFACVYHAEPSGPVDSTIAPRKLAPGSYLPLETPLTARALTFKLDQMVVDITDYRFVTLLPVIAADEELAEAYAEWTSDEAAASAIRLGGYPTFTQEDPRCARRHAGIGDTTLLTIDTTTGIMWGDSGVAQFFMHDEDLRRRDFSRVVYNWDCC